MDFGVAVSSEGGVTVVAVRGELDLDTAETFASALSDGVRSGQPEVRVDMSGVTFIDSSGLRCLIGAYKTLAAEDRVLRVVEPSRTVVRLLKATGQFERFT
ncbi:MAG: anti-sigma factor antagonist [Actinomycetota bacterium]|jgi:anti-sigma B factor antagonist